MEAAQLRLQIREEQTAVRQHQTIARQHQQVLNQLRQQLRLLEHQHRKKRKAPAWDDETPLIRLVNPQQIDRFRAMMADWQRRTDEKLTPSENTLFHFPPHLKHHVFRALAAALAVTPPVFRVSTIELCRYLSAHSNLGSPASIHRALYRAINGEKPK